jgi:hypothetical protein
MKNGFTYQDKEAEATIGSYGRRQAPGTLALVRRAQPFPYHPPELAGDEISFTVPVFSIR